MTTTIEPTTNASTVSKPRLWIGHIMGGLVIAFMLLDSIPKIIPNEATTTGMAGLGFQPHHIPIFGTLGFISTLLFAIPRTQILGAILLTGYFGGAIATHIRLDHPLFSLILFPVYMAALAWGSLWIKNKRLHKLIMNKN
jgi:hypothetical protein